MVATMRFDKWENPTSTLSVSMDQISGGSGLVPIVPTSVAVGSGTASVSSAGLVTYSGASSIRINGIFSGLYKRYIMEWDFQHASTTEIDSFFVFTKPSDATPNVTSGLYQTVQARYYGTGTSTAIQNSYNANVCVGPTFGSSSMGTATIQVNNPFDGAVYTSGYTHYSGTAPSASGYIWTGTSGFNQRSAESSDGFYIYPNGGTFSGTAKIYGIR